MYTWSPKEPTQALIRDVESSQPGLEQGLVSFWALVFIPGIKGLAVLKSPFWEHELVSFWNIAFRVIHWIEGLVVLKVAASPQEFALITTQPRSHPTPVSRPIAKGYPSPQTDTSHGVFPTVMVPYYLECLRVGCLDI